MLNFIKEHIIGVAIIVIILIFVIVFFKAKSDKKNLEEETINMDEMYQENMQTQELDETQSAVYNDLVYGE